MITEKSNRLQVIMITDYDYPISAPNTWKWGGSGYLYLHYWPHVDREPAINVDMVNLSGVPLQTINVYTTVFILTFSYFYCLIH